MRNISETSFVNTFPTFQTCVTMVAFLISGYSVHMWAFILPSCLKFGRLSDLFIDLHWIVFLFHAIRAFFFHRFSLNNCCCLFCCSWTHGEFVSLLAIFFCLCLYWGALDLFQKFEHFRPKLVKTRWFSPDVSFRGSRFPVVRNV